MQPSEAFRRLQKPESGQSTTWFAATPLNVYVYDGTGRIYYKAVRGEKEGGDGGGRGGGGPPALNPRVPLTHTDIMVETFTY